MKRGFYIILSAQFFSALADNALLIAAIFALPIIFCVIESLRRKEAPGGPEASQ